LPDEIVITVVADGVANLAISLFSVVGPLSLLAHAEKADGPKRAARISFFAPLLNGAFSALMAPIPTDQASPVLLDLYAPAVRER